MKESDKTGLECWFSMCICKCLCVIWKSTACKPRFVILQHISIFSISAVYFCRYCPQPSHILCLRNKSLTVLQTKFPGNKKLLQQNKVKRRNFHSVICWVGSTEQREHLLELLRCENTFGQSNESDPVVMSVAE